MTTNTDITALYSLLGQIDEALGGFGYVHVEDVLTRAKGYVAQQKQRKRMDQKFIDELMAAELATEARLRELCDVVDGWCLDETAHRHPHSIRNLLSEHGLWREQPPPAVEPAARAGGEEKRDG